MLVPNTTNFTLEEVITSLGLASNKGLSDCFADSVLNKFNDTYKAQYYSEAGNKNNLLMFRDYGEFLEPFIITGFTTADPTNSSGNNGTASVSFQGGQSPYTYTINSTGSPISTTNPISLTGLSANTTYIVNIYDSNSNQIDQSITLGETSFEFGADWVMVTYEFTDGVDLDTRTRIVTPDIGQNTIPTMIGYGASSIWPSSSPIIQWGLDNTGTGFESVLINLAQLKESYPNEDNVVIDIRCWWWVAVGVNAVKAACTFWKGGTPVKDGCVYNNEPKCWTNPTATEELLIDSVGLQIPGPSSNNANTSGNRLATLTYNFTTKVGVLNNADTTTPNV
jgi:hypothetical protein|tara:strand:- start:4 stop:1014 length:1011 start_codon:yes stop_codon:yes gene_type:complete